MRALVLGLLRLLFRVFFRRVEVVGEDMLPRGGGIVYAANHPNGLIDPLFLLVLPPEPAAFLAKEPLFRTPVVSWFVKAMGCLPVYRARDGHDTSANQRTLAAARALLEGGGAIGIFPEGTSHSGSELVPLKTGAARIALGAAAGSEQPVHVVPCGLYYTEKATFRSRAALVYGRAIAVPRVAVDEAGEPTREEAERLTKEIGRGLGEVVVQAESPDLLGLTAAATWLLEGVRRERGEASPLPSLHGGDGAGDVERGFRLRRHLLERYAQARARDPERVAALAARLRALEGSLALHGLALNAASSNAARRGAYGRVLRRWLWGVVISPLALVGIALHYPLYRLVGALALRTAAQELDEVATLKLLFGMLGFAVQWALMGVVAGSLWGWPTGLATALAAPLLAWLALDWSERVERTWARMHMGRARLDERLATLWAERSALYDELLALEAEVGAGLSP